jgi:hypothetical protein
MTQRQNGRKTERQEDKKTERKHSKTVIVYDFLYTKESGVQERNLLFWGEIKDREREEDERKRERGREGKRKRERVREGKRKREREVVEIILGTGSKKKHL